MAYSAGFSPHPKVSYAGAAPTGVASEAEYLEIALTEPCDQREIRSRLDAVLPAGLDIVDVVEAGSGSLADRLAASEWQAVLPGVEPAAVQRAVDLFMSSPAVQVQRLTKRGMRSFDARDAVIALTVRPPPATPDPAGGADGEQPRAILDVVVRHATPAVRPDDVLAGLRHVADLTPPAPPLVTRLAQGPLDAESGTVSDPLAPDRPPAADGVVAPGAGPGTK